MRKIYEVGDSVTVTSKEEFGMFRNGCKLSDEYPLGKPVKVTIVKSWYDYETGYHYVGEDTKGDKFYFGQFGVDIV